MINCITIQGDKFSPQYKQYNLDDATPFASDSTQLEIVSEAWTCGPPCNFRSLIWFDISALPLNATIVSAMLTITPKLNNVNGIPGSPMYGNANASVLRKNITPIAANPNWNNKPNTTTANEKLILATNSNSPVVIDMLDFTIDWHANSTNNYGITIQQQIEQAYNSMIFHSGTAAQNLQPQLEICYTNNCSVFSSREVTAHDAFVWSNNANTNFDNTPDLPLLSGTYLNISDTIRSLLYFDLSSIPANAIVSEAKLYLYNNPTSAFNGGAHYAFNGSNAGLVQPISSVWNDATVTWNSQPTAGFNNVAIIPPSVTPHDNYVVDVFGMVQNFIANPTQNNGMMLRLADESMRKGQILASSQCADTLLAPRLKICWELPQSVAEIAESNVAVFPNPFTDELFLQLKNLNHAFQIVVYNSQGALVKSINLKNFTNSTQTISLASYLQNERAGIYFLKIITNQKTEVLKVVKL